MIQLIKMVLLPVLLCSLLAIEYSAGYNDLDVQLYNAAQKGNITKMRNVLEQGADVNVRLGERQLTPLLIAAREGQLKAVRLLLKHGSDPNIRDAKSNGNAYHLALENSHHEIARVLLKSGVSRELKKPSTFFGPEIMVLAFLVLGTLITTVWVLYFSAVVPFLKANGIGPTAFFMQWRLPDELEAYAQLAQAKGKSLIVYHIAKYAYYCIYLALVFFVITFFKTCQVDQEKTQYEVLKDLHHSNLEHRLQQ